MSSNLSYLDYMSYLDFLMFHLWNWNGPTIVYRDDLPFQPAHFVHCAFLYILNGLCSLFNSIKCSKTKRESSESAQGPGSPGLSGMDHWQAKMWNHAQGPVANQSRLNNKLAHVLIDTEIIKWSGLRCPFTFFTDSGSPFWQLFWDPLKMALWARIMTVYE